MYMYNNGPVCPWMGQYGAERGMYPNGMPLQYPPRHPMPYHMMPPGAPPYWQGPGPSRPRGRGQRRGRGSANHHGNHRHQQRDQDIVKDMCCRCGERLQNSDEPGVHLCEGIRQARTEDTGNHEEQSQKDSETQEHETELEARLEKVLENLKDFVRNKYKSVTEALEEYVTDKINEISSLHKENSEERELLEKMKTELEEKTSSLLKQEQQLVDKQKRFTRDQDAFKKEMKKEREEVCRQWQQLRDEITRMEEMHEIQKGRIKLDVGGHVFTTSRLTLTRESDSMLAAMFSGRHKLLKEEDGCVFIDRDGTHFRYVLNYLRDGGLNMECLPRDRQLLRELKKEATYYQLHGLLQQIEKCIY